MKRLLYILFFVLNSHAFGCECHDSIGTWSIEKVKESIEHSQEVLIVEIIPEINNETEYALKVVEVFRSSLNIGDTLYGYYPDSCSGRPNKYRAGLWIFYGNYNEEYEKNVE